MKKIDILLSVAILIIGCSLMLVAYFKYFNAKWILVDHSDKIPFTTSRDGTIPFGTFYDMKSNGNYWLMGRNANMKWNHFYRYSSEEGFKNLSSEVPESDVNYISWNGKSWILSNINSFQNKQRLIEFDGNNFTDLSEQFRQLSCSRDYELTYESPNIQAVFTVGDSIIYNYTGPCYAKYEDGKFQDISNYFPNDKKRESYKIGDCSDSVCYLASESSTDRFIIFKPKDNGVEKISLSELTNGKIKNAIISDIKTNGKEVLIDLFQLGEEKKVTHIILKYYHDRKKVEEILKSEVSYSDSNVSSTEHYLLGGWDSKFSTWIILGSKCKPQSRDIGMNCEGTVYHIDGDELSPLPIKLPEFDPSDFRMEVFGSDYMISSRNRLYEVTFTRQ
ncbi:MAG: hypothetical protein AAB521_00630 [Patescibacteria group bacterium]